MAEQQTDAASRPQWTRTPPAAPGWYWLKRKTRIVVVRVDEMEWAHHGSGMCPLATIGDSDAYWCGPIEPPA